MQLRLEHRQMTLHTVPDSEIGAEGITIGRAKTCTWRTPADDGGISGEHLRLTRRGKSLWIEDLQSTNGIFLKGKRVQKRRLEIGDQYSFGNACLSVEADPATTSAATLSWLLVPTPQGGKRKVLLDKPVTTLGASPEADIRFPSEMVSQNHAEIRRQPDGGYWLVDLNSKNGTSVNEVPLAGGKERLLKEQDHLSLAQFECIFFDGSLPRGTSRLGLKFAVILGVLLLSWAGYNAYLRLTPAAAAFVRRAEVQAAQGRFDAALEDLTRAGGGRGYHDQELTIANLRRSVQQWKSVSDAWQRSLTLLENKNWVEASRILAGIVPLGRDAWSWNEEAPLYRDEALQTRAHLDALLIAQNAARRDRVDPDELAAIVASGNRSLAALSENAPPHLLPLREELRPALAALTALLDNNQSLESALNRLVQENPPPVPEVLASVEKLQTAADGSVRRRAEAILIPLRDLHASHGRIAARIGRIFQLDLADIHSFDPQLPPVEACALDPRISQLRVNLHYMSENLKNVAAEMESLLAPLHKNLPLDGSMPASLRALADDTRLRKALACDAFELRMPRRTREQADSHYDALLGVEEFHLRLQALPEPFNPEILGGMPAFIPELRNFETLCRHAERFITYLDEPQHQWLNQGRIRQTYEAAGAVLTQRDQLLARWLRQVPSLEGREAVILGGLISALAPGASPPKIDGKPAPLWTQERFGALRAELLALNRTYLESSPEERIRLREQLLSTGLPGDGILRPLWSARDEARPPSP